MQPELTDDWMLGPLRVRNRVMLAPLAGIGNWCVRLQAKRYGAGMAVSEMVSSHAVHHGNVRTCTEMLRIDPAERLGGPVAIQLFGADPQVMRSAAEVVAKRGADAIDLNMGCPVPKVCKTGAGAALLADHSRAVALARAAAEGSGGLPVTAKLRIGLHPGETDGIELAERLVEDGGVAAIALHPRPATVRHKGKPDYLQVARLAERVGVPVILTGGLSSPEAVREAYEASGATAVMLARGSLGNPWLFSTLLGTWQGEPTVQEVHEELHWMIDRAVEHLGRERATGWMRKAYAWYLPRFRLPRPNSKALLEGLHRAPTLRDVEALLEG